jgi:hypothetical protein
MPITRIENIFRMRDLLGNPNPQKPSFHQLFRQEISEEMDIVNATNNTGLPWATATYQLNYSTNQNVYSINVSDWGKVLYVCRLTGDPYVQRITVPFDDLNNQRYGYVWQDFWGAYGGVPWVSETPEHMSFYRDGVTDAQYKVSINPRPSQNYTYEITYIPGYIGIDDPLEAGIQMPEHAELVRLRGAMALLNDTEWIDDFDKNRLLRSDRAKGFEYQLNRKERLFSEYIKSINIPKDTWVSAWND